MTGPFMDGHLLRMLWIMPLLLLLLAYAAHKRRKAVGLLLSRELADRVIDRGVAAKRWVSSLCLLIALGFMILGLARPAWDTERILMPKTGRDLVFLLDISQSMLAEDQPPSRLACAKNAILQCLDEAQSGRVGLVVFAGATSIRCPLTRDTSFFRSTLDDLAPDSVPVGGTRIGDAIAKTAEKVLTDADADFRDVILITDGENHGSISTNALAKLANRDARLIIVGLGSDSVPAEIPIRREGSDKVRPLTYRDEIVYTRQHAAELEALAEQVPDSIYLNVGTSPLNLADIYRVHAAATVRQSGEELNTERPREQYWRFLLVALVFLIASYLPWLQRKQQPFAPQAAGRLLLPVTILCLVLPASQARAESRGQLFGEGISAYREGDYDEAIEKFNAAQQKRSNPVIDYNLGTAYYRAGDLPSALSYFVSASQAATDGRVSIDAAYNLGNTLFKIAFSEQTSDKADAMDLVQRSISTYESVLMRNPDHEDALFNLQIARQALELIKKGGDRPNENQEGTEETDTSEEDEPNQESDSTDDKANPGQTQNAEDEEQEPPNMSPEDILEEEMQNKLKRWRKKHAEFSKTKKNW